MISFSLHPIHDSCKGVSHCRDSEPFNNKLQCHVYGSELTDTVAAWLLLNELLTQIWSFLFSKPPTTASLRKAE